MNLNLLNPLFSTLKRVYGQLSRYYDLPNLSNYIPERPTAKRLEKAINQVRFDAERQKIRREIEAREAREEEKRRRAELEFSNMLYLVQHYPDSCKTTAGRADVANACDAIVQMMTESRQTWGAEFVVDAIRPWMTETDNKVEQLAYAIYSDKYNTNNTFFQKTKQGAAGRQKFIDDVAKIARSLKVPTPPLYFVNEW